jgi:hypothetical protein
MKIGIGKNIRYGAFQPLIDLRFESNTEQTAFFLIFIVYIHIYRIASPLESILQNVIVAGTQLEKNMLLLLI